MNLNDAVHGQAEATGESAVNCWRHSLCTRKRSTSASNTVALKSVTLCNDSDISEAPRKELEANKVAAP